MLLQLGNAGFRILHPLFSFKVEGLGHNRNRQRTQIPGNLCNDRSCTGTGAAAHTSGDEHQVRPFQGRGNFFAAFFGSTTSHLRNSACTQTLCQLFADLNLNLCVCLAQSLTVCIDGDKINSAQSGIHHAVDGIVSAAAASDHLN